MSTPPQDISCTEWYDTLGRASNGLKRVLSRFSALAYGIYRWQDRTSMEGGKDWWQQIEEALRSKHVEYLVLVMTPNALRSNMVQREWRLARNLGICVEPVIASKNLDFQSIPLWMRATHFVDPDVSEQWDGLSFL